MAGVISRSSVCHSPGSLELRLDLMLVKQNEHEEPSKGDQQPAKMVRN